MLKSFRLFLKKKKKIYRETNTEIMKLFGIWGLVFSVSFLEKFDEGAMVWVYGFEGERKEKRLIMEMTKLSDGIFVGYYYERVITGT